MNPLLIGLLLIKIDKPPAEDLPRFSAVEQLEERDLQRIADAVQSKLIYPDDAPNGTVVTLFQRNIKTATDRAFCESNGHIMEEALDTAFPPLKMFTRQRGKLAMAVIDRVLGDYPILCPKLLSDAFEKLAMADP